MPAMTCDSFRFYSHHNTRDLHSFPTRRSSDLGGAGGAAGVPSMGTPRLAAAQKRACTQCFPACKRVSAPLPDERSEEHTSELQSLRHLVCRLLLEKKNTNIN